jgi:hypothetical protein
MKDLHGLNLKKPHKEILWSFVVRCGYCRTKNTLQQVYRGNVGLSYIIRITFTCTKCAEKNTFTDRVSIK